VIVNDVYDAIVADFHCFALFGAFFVTGMVCAVRAGQHFMNHAARAALQENSIIARSHNAVMRECAYDLACCASCAQGEVLWILDDMAAKLIVCVHRYRSPFFYQLHL
jgi:hypothetical protein